MSYRGTSISKLCLGLFAAIVWPVTALAAPEPIRDISTEIIDQRQLRTAVASRTLTWLTGTSANNDYVSIGRIANYFGFVGLRVASGQTLSRSDVAMDTLAVLDDQQRAALIALNEDQAAALSGTHEARKKLNRALEGLLIGETISHEAFLKLGGNYGASEAELGRVIAQRFGEIAQSLTDEQKSELMAIRHAYISGQGHRLSYDKPKIRLDIEAKTDLVNSAARFLSWITGDEVYNDYEVVGKPSQHFGFVSLRLDTNHGVKRGAIANEVLSLLSADQKAYLDQSAAQNADVFEDFLTARASLMRYYETAQKGAHLGPQKVALYGEQIGRIEADMSWAQAQAMLAVRDSLTESQTTDLMAMRAKYTVSEPVPWSEDKAILGRQLFAQCVLCHNPGANYRLAPNLENIIGAQIAGNSDFKNYSPALKAFAEENGIWTQDLLMEYLESPQSLVKGSYMAYAGLKDEEDRAALIAYLMQME